jgi:uncharacterized membrane protein
VATGENATRTFTVRNTGTAQLTGLSVRIEGANAADFMLTTPPAASVNGGANTTFTVRFTPSGLGAHAAVLRVTSNDADEHPFDISLSGSGVPPAPEIVVEEPVGTGLVDGSAATNFGSVVVGSSATRTYTVRNTGNAMLSGLAVTFSGANAADYNVTTPPAATVAPGANTSFTVSFSPGGFGSRTAALMLANNDADENPFDVALSGSGIATPPVTRTINATDRGWYSATGSHTPSNDNYFAGIDSSFSPDDLRSFFIFDIPAMAANETLVSAELRLWNPSGGFSSPDATEIYEVHHVSTAPAAIMAGTAGTAGFADLLDGALFGSKSVSNSDNGTIVVLPLNSAALAEIAARSGSQAAFGGSLTTLASQVAFLFGGTGGGNISDTQLVFTTVTSYSDAEIVVEQPAGTGLTDGVSSVSFGGIAPGTTTDRVFTLRNIGIYDLTGLGITITGANAADFSVTASPTAPLAPAGSTSFTVRFAPVTGGLKNAMLSIASNDPDENPFEIALAGTGVVPAPEIVVEQPVGTSLVDGTAAVSFGYRGLGTNGSLVFTVRNTGTANLTGLGISIDGTHAADFSVSASPTAPVAPGGSTTFTVQFAPSATGLRTAALHLASDDWDENPFDIALSGNGYTAPAGMEFKILSLGTTGSAVVDHDAITSDDRGGIAVTTERVFVTGDSATSRHALTDLSGGASIGRVSNGLCSDIGTGMAYVLAHNGVEIIGGSSTVSQLIELNPQTGALTGTIIPLSTSFVTGGPNGVFSGNGRIVIHNGTRVYDILVPSGVVNDLGPMSAPSWYGSESWASWGVAEFFDGSIHLAYRPSSGSTIVRSRVPDGQVTTIGTFSNLGDMASWTVSPITNRWYFHYEGSAQFGGSSETLGYADATLEMGPPTQPPAIISPLTAAAYVGNPFSYQIRATRSPTSYNATGLPAWLSVNTTTGVLSGTPTATGTHAVSISATNAVGTTTETLTITVSTAFATVAVFTDPLYVNSTIAQQLQTALTGIGCAVTTFTGTSAADWNTAYASAQVVIVPRIDNSLTPGTALAQAINLNLAAGKGLVMAGSSYYNEYFLNALRGWSLSPWSDFSGVTLTKVAGVPGFVNSPASFPVPSYTYLTQQFYMPSSIQRVYDYSIGCGAYVSGRIGGLGYDWNSGPHAVWDIVLKDMLSSVLGYVSAPEIIVRNSSSTELQDGSATAQSFGNTAIGQNSSLTFYIKNDGFADLTGLGITIDGANAADFSVTANPTAPLAPVGTTSFTVRFTPSASGTRTAALHIASNDASESSFDILLSGTGFIPAPEIVVEQPAGTGLTDGVSTVAFGTVPLTASLSRTFTLRNTGTATLSGIALSISGTHAADFALTTAPAASVAAGSSTTFTVRFIPGSAGARTATLQIASNDADENPFDVAVSGSGVMLRGQASLFASGGYVDTSTGGEMENTRSALMNAGYAVTTFTGITAADWNAAFAANVVVVPELEMSTLVLAADALLAINTQLDAGKGFIVMGDVSTRETALLNSLRGWALASGSNLEFLTLTKVIGVPGFGNSPASLTGLNATYSITTASLPAGAQPVYQNGLNTAVFLQGRVGFMAYDWNAGPDSTWSTVLGDLITELTQVIDGPEIVVERPAGTGLIDGSSTAALGYAPVGGEVTSSFTLRNIGTQPLTGILASVDGTHAADFSVTTAPAGSVAPGGSTTFTVRFAPSVAGNRSATLRIASNDANENPFDIALTGTTSQILFEDDFDPGIDTPLWSAFSGTVRANTAGQAAGAGSTGNSLHFDGTASRFATTIPLNTTSGGGIGFKIALANGSGGLWETADSGEDAVLEYSNDGTTFTQIGGPYTNRTWQSVVVGIPVAAQTVSTRFRWRQLSNSGSGFDHWAIEDVQIGPAISTAPEIAVEQPVGTGLTDGVSTVTFGSVATGANTTLTFTIRNSGSADLTGLAATLDGTNAADFTVTTTPASTVAPAGTTTFVVRFAPGATGSRSATLRLASNDADENPFDINLSGTGAIPVPEIAVEQPVGTELTDGVSTVNFGLVAISANTTLTFTIRNSGSGNLTGLAATIDGPNAADFTVTTAPASTVAPAGTTTFVVLFAPGAAGSRSATLRLASNDADENPFDINLSGTGLPPGTVTVVIPNAQTTLEGNSNNGFPFNLSSHGHTGMRYQQVYAASELGATGLVTITHLAFRRDVSNSSFASTLPDIQIELMTTAATPATLSTTYASNRGADAVMVHPRGSLSLSSSGTGTPPPFDIVIPLTTPFVYNPALGNLLMEVRNFGGGSTTQFDSQSYSASVGRVFNPTGNSDPNLAVGTHESSGLVTWFTFVNGDLTSAPEIAVEHPVGSNLTDGAASISFGSAAVPVSRVFTLRNNGGTALSGISLSIDGANAADFSITTPPPASVAPGASATFTISFTPSTPGARAATLRVASNDADENPFDIALAATAVTPAGGLDNWLPPALPDRTPMGTPHQDGVPNLLKYAFNLDSNAPDNRTLPPGGTAGLPAIQPQPAGNVFRFEYLRRIGSGLIYTPEKNSSLESASWITLSSTPVVTPVNDTWERVIYEEPVNTALTPVCFGRVRVTMP